MKRNWLSLLLVLALLVGMMPAAVFADGGSATAYVRIVGANNSEFVTYETVSIEDGVTTMLELTNKAVMTSGSAVTLNGWGFVDTIDGADIGTDYWMCMLNDSGDVFNTGTFDTITAKDGDLLVLYPYNNGDYAWISAKEGADVNIFEWEDDSYITGSGTFDLTASGYDADYNLVDYKVEGATVTVKNTDGSDLDPTASLVSKETVDTDENGAFNIDFYGSCKTADLNSFSYTYDLYAAKSGINTAFCRVTLTKDGLTFSQPEGDAGTAEDVVPKSNVALDDLMAGIAAGYAAKDSVLDWAVMDMAAYEEYMPSMASKLSETAVQNFIDSVAAAVTAEEAPAEKDVAKMIVILQSQGYDPCKVYPAGSSEPIDLIKLLDGYTHDTDSWTATYTMAAYAQSEATKSQGKAIAESVLTNQNADGSWESWGSKVDATANMIAGLAFYSDDADVAAAIDNAVAFLASAQKDSGAFDSWGYGADANTEGIIAVGLAAAGVDPATDTRFQKGEIFALDGLLQFALADNSGFGYQDNTTLNDSATEQGFRALIAAANVAKTGKAFNIYDFSANTDLQPAKAGSSGGGGGGGKTPTGEDITVKVSVQTLDGYWLKNYSAVVPGDGATAYYVLTKSFEKNNIEYKDKNGGYIYELTYNGKTLGEFDEGPNSGWLYKVNGELPTVSTKEYDVKDGDVILFYYTEDWTKDPDAASNAGIKPSQTSEETGETKKSFIDVKDSDWYDEYAEKAAELGLFAGYSAGKDADGNELYEFRGAETMTRAMFVTVLRAINTKIKGSTPEAADAGFADVADGAWYESSVNWAFAEGITAGKGENFGVDDPVTREQMAVFLYTYAKSVGKVAGEADLSKLDAFSDADEVSGYAKEAVAWLVGEGLMAGRGSGKLAPGESSTRAEVAAFLVSCYEYLSK